MLNNKKFPSLYHWELRGESLQMSHIECLRLVRRRRRLLLATVCYSHSTPGVVFIILIALSRNNQRKPISQEKKKTLHDTPVVEIVAPREAVKRNCYLLIMRELRPS